MRLKEKFMIPKKIHYCWFGGADIPKNLRKYINSWKKYCPDYEIKLWNESNFDVYSHPFIKAAYESKAWAFVSDYARLKIIYDEGGIYLDTDVELLKSLDSLLFNKCYIGIEQNGKRCNTGLGFGAEKHNSVVRKMLDEYNNIVFDKKNLINIECPKLNTNVIKSIGEFSLNDISFLPDVTVYPSKFMDPISTGRTKNLLCDETISIHHYSASWTSGKDKLKRRIVELIGVQRYFKIKQIFGRTL